jgi:hypothetical protein
VPPRWGAPKDYKSESQRERSSPVGWIRLHKKLIGWGWYADGNTLRVFLHLLLTANYKPSEFLGRTIDRGQAVFGLQSLADVLKLSVRQVRVALEHLKTTGEVTIETTNRFSIATLVKYSDYQCSDADDDKPNDKPNDSQMTNKRQTDDKRMTTSKKKEGKKEEDNVPPVVSKDTTSPKGDALFELFWKQYPRHEAKQPALTKWRQFKVDDAKFAEIMAGLDRSKQSRQWKDGFIPHARTWLNQRRWEDETTPETKADTGYRRFGEV